MESDDGGGDAEATGRRGPWQGEPERVGADRAAEGGRGGGVGSGHESRCGPGPSSELGEVELGTAMGTQYPTGFTRYKGGYGMNSSHVGMLMGTILYLSGRWVRVQV